MFIGAPPRPGADEARPAAERVTLLKGDVSALQSSGALSAGQASSLRSKLDAALAALAKGNKTVAINNLQAFVNQLNSLVTEGVLTPVQAQPLIAEAQAVIVHLRS